MEVPLSWKAPAVVLMSPEQAKAPVLLVTVQPVLPEPPPRRMSPVLVAPRLIVLAPLASTVRAPVPLMAVPDTLRLLTALAVRVPPLTLPPLRVPPLMVAVLIVLPVVTAPALVTVKAAPALMRLV